MFCVECMIWATSRMPSLKSQARATALPSAHTLPLAIDGTKTIAALHWRACSTLPLPVQAAYVDGDARFVPIAAASILAKTVRDALMARLAQRFPVYGFAAHKGYGTKEHTELIKKYGPCEIHRMSFLKNIL